jgi:hypothetical protein
MAWLIGLAIVLVLLGNGVVVWCACALSGSVDRAMAERLEREMVARWENDHDQAR